MTFSQLDVTFTGASNLPPNGDNAGQSITKQNAADVGDTSSVDAAFIHPVLVE
jgi:hypothetical protein